MPYNGIEADPWDWVTYPEHCLSLVPRIMQPRADRVRESVRFVGPCLDPARLADLLVPIFAGRLVDAAALADRDLALRAMLAALAALALLGLAALALRHIAFLAIIRMTLRAMVEATERSFARVQRFSADWHAGSFAGSTVRQITRGMSALDLLHDTILVALLPALVVLVGATLLLEEEKEEASSPAAASLASIQAPSPEEASVERARPPVPPSETQASAGGAIEEELLDIFLEEAREVLATLVRLCQRSSATA